MNNGIWICDLSSHLKSASSTGYLRFHLLILLLLDVSYDTFIRGLLESESPAPRRAETGVSYCVSEWRREVYVSVYVVFFLDLMAVALGDTP